MRKNVCSLVIRININRKFIIRGNRANSPYAKWDPTDPDANNPWRTAKPTISGVTNITVLQGEEIDYISNVSAVDVFGAVLNVTTRGNVDATTVGEYAIHYTATDSRGNKVTASAIITVVEHPTDNEGIPPNLLLTF